MSMELLVVLALHRAPSLNAWQKALDARHIPVEFTHEADLKIHTGFLPVSVAGTASGFEFSENPFSDAVATYPVLKQIKVEQPVVYAFEYGGDLKECMAVFYAAQALVSDFGGTAYDPQGARVMSENELSQVANACKAMSGQ